MRISACLVCMMHRCTCTGRVRFGKGDAWSQESTSKGQLLCGASKFDRDPAVGVVKECQCAHGLAPSPPPALLPCLLSRGAACVNICCSLPMRWYTVLMLPLVHSSTVVSAQASSSETPWVLSLTASHLMTTITERDPSRYMCGCECECECSCECVCECER